MPELPEVETVRRGLAPVMVGRRIERVDQRRPDLRFPFPDGFVERLEGRTITALSRRAKYLLAGLSSDEVLVMHLGMSGRFSVATPETDMRPGVFHHAHGGLGTHDHVVFHLSGDARVTYNDVRRFGFMDLLLAEELEASRHFAGLGLEPLGGELSGDRLAELFAGRRAPLKAALLDQRLVAGLGNIYVCEALHRSGLHPEAPASSIASPGGRPREAAHRLAKVIREVLLEAVEAGGSTLRDHAQVDGTLGYFQHRFRVYDRLGESCTTPGCPGTIERLVQAGRSTFLCASCQPRPRRRG
ncbi:MAG: bifunctional DNA-formamidopyrimidine glycosylase/DNA-(apurinic or apyrimidinic site) lyase [Myxococcales bacterium]|jgi:formamidopyrimidine-DNA glycosylase